MRREPMADDGNAVSIKFKSLIISSLIFGFFLIPTHEFGHVAGYWITGHPAAMSYARDYMLSEVEKPFLGLLGGPLLPLIISAISVGLIYMRVKVSSFYPLAILGSFDRLILYLFGVLPSDEFDLAMKVGWNIHAFKYIFLSAEIFLLALVLLSLVRYKVGIKRSLLVFSIPLVSFVGTAAFGVFVVERFVFPVQYKLQFGLIRIVHSILA